MSALDLSAAVEAALRAVHTDCGCDDQGVRDDAQLAVTAAAPLIEAAVREQIAAEIDEFEPDDIDERRHGDWKDGLYWAASIARAAR
jgi:hypothetical protein